jgi:hypothetical protein
LLFKLDKIDKLSTLTKRKQPAALGESLFPNPPADLQDNLSRVLLLERRSISMIPDSKVLHQEVKCGRGGLYIDI